MSTVVDCMAKLGKKGFTESFMVKENGLWSPKKKKLYKPEEVRIATFYRFEGESDPADSSILYAIETNDGVKGIVTDAYGPYSDSKVSKFIKRVEEIYKVIHPSMN